MLLQGLPESLSTDWMPEEMAGKMMMEMKKTQKTYMLSFHIFPMMGLRGGTEMTVGPQLDSGVDRELSDVGAVPVQEASR